MYSVLIADDELRSRNGLASTIVKQGIFKLCGVAKDGLEALRLASINKPEIIVTDINMPHLDGLTFISQLQAVHNTAKIVVVSGYDNFSYAQQAIRLGVKDYLLKPIDPHELLQLLKLAKQEIDTRLKLLHELEKHCTPTHRGSAAEVNVCVSNAFAQQQGFSNNILSSDEQVIPNVKRLQQNNIAQLCEEMINDRFTDPSLRLDQLALELYVSPNYLRWLFKKHTGKSFVQYLTSLRMEKAAQLLRTTTDKVHDVARAVSFEDARYFSTCFKQQYGMGPSKYRERYFDDMKA